MESYKEGVKAKLPALTLYLGLVVIFIVFAVICSMMGKNFLTLNNMFNIITQASIISIIAIGASLVIVTGGIDLSVGSIVGFVGIFGGLILGWYALDCHGDFVYRGRRCLWPGQWLSGQLRKGTALHCDAGSHADRQGIGASD